MQPKTLRLLALAAAVLAAGTGLQAFLAGRRPKKPYLWPEAPRARRLRISGPGGELELGRESAGWELTLPFRFRADAPKIERFLELLAKAELSEPVADDPARHAAFELAASTGLRFSGFLGDAAAPAVDLLVGKSGAGPASFLTRRPGESAVREARGLGRSEFENNPGRWADRLICAVDQSRILSLEIRSHRGRLALSQKEGRWRLGEPGRELAPESFAAKVQPILTLLTRLEAQNVVSDQGLHPFVLAGLAAPEYRLELRLASAGQGPGQEEAISLEIGPQKPGFNHPLRKLGTAGVVYELRAWQLSALKLLPEELKTLPRPPGTPE